MRRKGNTMRLIALVTRRAVALAFVVSIPIAFSPALAQPKLEAFADIVGGAGESCGSFGMPSQLSFFVLSLLFQGGVGNGISNCGYSGALSTVSQNGGSGTLTNSQALGPQRTFFFGDTYAVLDLQQNGGPTYELMNAHNTRGSSGTISNGAPPSGWTSSTGSLSGSSTFFSVLLPITWGTQWSVKAGLLAWSYGTADADFLNTARVSGIDLFDANQVAVTNFTLTSASGTDYLNVGAPTTVPEPSTLMLSLVSLGALALGRVIRRRR